MHRSIPFLLIACSTGVLLAQSGPPLELRVVEGAAAVVPADALSARRFVVEVTRGGKPAHGAAVTFRLPDGAVSGRFASGFSSEMVVAGADGRAMVYGIRWGGTEGDGEIQVSAGFGEQRATAAIPFTISGIAKPTKADRSSGEKIRAPGGSKKWWVIAGVAGGALAGLAFAGGGGQAAPAAAYQPAVVTPTVGAPSISVGRP